MNNMYFALTIFPLIVISGCSDKQIYESTQPKYNEAECMKLPKSQYEECMQHDAQSYEEYEKERREIISE